MLLLLCFASVDNKLAHKVYVRTPNCFPKSVYIQHLFFVRHGVDLNLFCSIAHMLAVQAQRIGP